MEDKERTGGFVHRVREEEDGKMVQQVLRNRFRFSRRMFRRLKMSQGVEVNGEIVYLTSRVKAGDVIRVHLPREEEGGILPQPIPLSVVHEDDDLIVIDKPPGLVVHPTKGHPDGTLANGLVHYWQRRGESRTIRPVTRLDKDTSGLIVFAKHAYAHAFLSRQMADRLYRREYIALVHGEVREPEGTIDAPIARDPDHPVRRKVDSRGVEAVTHFCVEERFSGASRLRLWLGTGRTHQIRVHLSHRGHPIIGDALYGGAGGPWKMDRQALHAGFLRLIHPREREERSWYCPLPGDMKDLLRQLSGERQY